MKTWLDRTVAVAALLSVLSGSVAPANDVDYQRDVRPLLATKCFACHGALKQKGGLRLDTAALARQGGESGPAVVANKPDESLLLAKIVAPDAERMPPVGEGERLTDAQVAVLRAWIAGGAAAPDESVPPDPRLHWSFQPPVRPAVPVAKDAAWNRSPVDAFVAVQHERLGLVPVPLASPDVLLRRLYLDLIGLPPLVSFEPGTTQVKEETLGIDLDLAAFAPGTTDYEKVVERLLAHPGYGQRWGRHWMDIWRYADWSGYGNEIRYSQYHIWRWRDWIIESLNAGKGYDRMLAEMLAGDELAPGDPDTLRATGYLARNWYKFNRHTWLDDTVEHTAKAFLGLTMNCARCHDHKYDPIDQPTYYSLRAIFEPHNVRLDPVAGETDVMKDGLARVYDADAAAPTWLFLGGNDKRPDKSRAIAPGVPTVLGGEFAVSPVSLPAPEYYPALREYAVRDAQAAAEKAVMQAEADLAKLAADAAERPVAEKSLATARAALEAVQARIAAERAKYADAPDAAALDALATAAGAAQQRLALCRADEALLKAQQALDLARRNEAQAGDKGKAEVEKQTKALADAQKKFDDARAALDKPAKTYEPLGKEFPRTSSGRRTALARWITDRRHPLTARVAANHVWGRHVGTPLVENVFDFGLRTPRPGHAELLDWLAVELMENGWSLKHLHRRIVSSRTYALSSTAGASPSVAVDPDNRWQWRTRGRRLEAEIVRDSLLHVAGALDASHGGPEIHHHEGESSRRRSVYFRHAYERKMRFVELFDGPSEMECYRRNESVTPQQSLALANSPLSLGQARVLAAKLAAQPATEDVERTFVTRAFGRVLARQPSAAEIDECLRFLSDQAARLKDLPRLAASSGPPAAVKPATDPVQRARESLVHVLMNHSDFVTVR